MPRETAFRREVGTKVIKPSWIVQAERFIGLKEIKGSEHNSEILQWWKDIKRSGIKDDETPYCAAFVGAMLERSGIKSTRFEGALSYLEWGSDLTAPIYGCVVVFSRSGGGHVGFVVGEDENGRLMVLGGNQGDAVSVAPFDRARVAGYRWPDGIGMNTDPLPIIASNAMSSTNEA